VSEANLVRITPGGTMWIQPAWGSCKVIHNTGLKEAFNSNYNFTEWITGDPVDWSINGSVTYLQWTRLRIFANTSFANNYVQSLTSFSGDTTVTQGIKVSMNISISVPASVDITMFFRLSLNANKYYNIATNNWDTIPPGSIPYIQKNINNSGSEVYLQDETLEFITASLPLTAINYLRFDIMAPVCSDTDAYIIVKDVKLTLVKYSGSDAVAFEDNDFEYDTSISSDNNYKPDDIELLLADTPVTSPPTYNAKNIYTGLLYEDAALNTATTSWTADGRTDTLIGLMQSNLIDFFQEPQQVLSVKIYTKLIDACTVLQEINNTTTYNKYFMIKRATWEAKEGYWEVEAHQLIFDEAERTDYIISEGDVGEDVITSEGDVGESNLIRE